MSYSLPSTKLILTKRPSHYPPILTSPDKNLRRLAILNKKTRKDCGVLRFKLELRAMDKILKQSLGFDVSQEKFDVALFVCGEDLAPREVASETFDNTKNGFKKLSQWYDKLIDKQLPILASMEATGVYHEHLCRHVYRSTGQGKRSIT